MVRQTTVRHVQAELKGVMPQIKGGAGSIQPPAPAAAAVFQTVAIPTDTDCAGAADHHNAGAIGEGPAQSCAFIAGGEGLVGGDGQGVSQQCRGLVLQRGSLFDPAGTNHNRINLVGSGLKRTTMACGQCGAHAVAHGLLKSLDPSIGRQMADARSCPFTDDQPLAARPLADPATGAGLAGIQSCEQHQSLGQVAASVARQNQPISCTSGRKKMVSVMPWVSSPAMAARLPMAIRP